MNKNFLAVVVSLIFLGYNSFGQFPGCPTVDAGPDQNLTCANPCTNLTATPFPTGATTSYSVASIPHDPPIAYNAAGGTAVSVGTDDVWSPIINLPFTFCYYGQSYTTCKVGSNGAIQLGPTAGGGNHPWSFSVNLPNNALVNAGHIFGVYHDIDPSKGPSPGTVRYYILGQAPCRIFVVTFNNLAHFGGSCGANTFRSTFMMVLYETTNVIDVYVQRKDLCTSWNSGRAIIGIQNQNGSQGVAAPGRNTTPTWSVPANNPEGWRFTPSGAPIYTVEWLEGGNVIANTTTVNVCPASPTTYTARATYQACSGVTVVVEDQVTLNPASDAPVLNLSSMTPALCGLNNGALTVSASGGVPGYQYSINGGATFQASGSFSGLSEGPHTITVIDASGCQGEATFEVGGTSDLAINLTANAVSCAGANNGQINAQGVNGGGGYSYSLNGGPTQTSGTFSGLAPGSYTVTVIDAGACEATGVIEITEPVPVQLNLVSQTDASCSGFNDGSIEIAASNGVLPYSYSLNVGAGQLGGVFSNLVAGTYVMSVLDANGCGASINVTLSQPTAIPTSINYGQNAYCNVGSTTINQSGVSGGTYTSTPVGLVLDAASGSIDLETSQPGSYTVTYSYVDGVCAYTATTNVQVLPNPVVFAGNNVTVCPGQTVVLTGSGANTYVWDNGVVNGVPFVPNQTMTYTVVGTTQQGCVGTSQVTVFVQSIVDVEFETSVRQGCVPLTTVFNAILPLDAANCTWVLSNGVVLQGCVNVPYTFNVPGCYNVTLQVETINGCTASVTYNNYICVDQDPIADFTANPQQVTTVDPTIQFLNSSMGASTYQWSFGDGGGSTSVNPSHTYPDNETNTYVVQLIAYSAAGCVDTARVIVSVIEDLIFYVPNAFTPDNDKFNQLFLPIFTSGFDPMDYHLSIYNRWGEILFESYNHEVGWDGTYGVNSTKAVKDGTYIWKIEFKTSMNDERKLFTGHVSILK
jgi:large repetitive protein